MKELSEQYETELAGRTITSHAHYEFQLVGAEVAELLCDHKHTALYIKFAKDLGKDRVLSLAKDIAARPSVKNRGAYFMKAIFSEKSQIK